MTTPTCWVTLLGTSLLLITPLIVTGLVPESTRIEFVLEVPETKMQEFKIGARKEVLRVNELLVPLAFIVAPFNLMVPVPDVPRTWRTP